MIVWGGRSDGSALNDGGRYDPAGNSWTAVTTTGAPAARGGNTAVWTGSEMIVWGGTPGFTGGLNDGGRYDPAGRQLDGGEHRPAPPDRARSHTAVWTGSEMIVWGGGMYSLGGYPFRNDGALPRHAAATAGRLVTTTGAPAARSDHTAVWTGSEMIVWGGYAISSAD